jgi:hypothetical protein
VVVEWIQLAQVVTVVNARELSDTIKNVKLRPAPWSYVQSFSGSVRRVALLCTLESAYESYGKLKQQRGYSERSVSHSGPLRSGLSGHSYSVTLRSWPVRERYAVRGTPADAATCPTVV